MRTKRRIGAGLFTILVFAYSVFVTKRPLNGFIVANAFVDVTLAYSYLDEHGRLPDIWGPLVNPHWLGLRRLVGAFVGTVAILAYVLFINRNPVTALLALSVFWVLIILSVSPPPNPFPDSHE